MSKKIGRNDPCICGSGKKYKRCCLGKEIDHFEGGVVAWEQDLTGENIRQLILREGTEELTDDLIKELTKKGWDEKLLLSQRDEEGRYCRERDSIIGPWFSSEDLEDEAD